MIRSTFPFLEETRRNRCRAATTLLAVSGTLLLFGATAQAQSHEASQGGYVVRSTLVDSTSLPAESLQQQGIDAAPDRAILNVVVLKDGSGAVRPTVRARVEATVRGLTGTPRSIPMREVVANDRLSYLGLVQHAPSEVLMLQIQATPAGSAQTIDLSYQEQMVR